MSDQVWSWLLSVVGVGGFLLAGRKIWWAWYINIACQALWFAYAIVSSQWGFIVGAFFYTGVFGLNAYRWTKEHFNPEPSSLNVAIGEITELSINPDGVKAVGRLYRDE